MQCPRCSHPASGDSRGKWWCTPQCPNYGKTMAEIQEPVKAPESEPEEIPRPDVKMHQCQGCGAKVEFYTNAKSGRTTTYHLPPLEESGVVFVKVGGDEVMATMGYIVHDCSGERTADEPTEYENHVTKMAVLETTARDAIDQHSCDRCGAEVGTDCFNLSDRRRGITSHTNWPHEGRGGWAMQP